ncbi:MAG: PA0069 family radical SAM protein [Phycisphaeraceae bacterium]
MAEPRRPVNPTTARGRGAQQNPTNRFESQSLHVLGDHLDELLRDEHTDPAGRQIQTLVLRDQSRSILNPVDSPDIGFAWSINPYRGCEHGCIYCYARPGHEYLGLSSGLDFETKIFAKPDAPDLLRKELARPRWYGETIAMSGVTDCYQPVERKLRITRGCLELFADCRQPVGIVTKSRLVLRDLDLLKTLAEHDAVRVAVSLTTLDKKLAAKMEPRAASPADRLETIRQLSAAGIPVIAMLAPIVPALNDREIPALLKASAEAGAASASYVMLRLPYQIKDLFTDWLTEHFPDRRSHVEKLLRESRSGKLYDAQFGDRMKGTGPYAEQIAQTVRIFKQRYNLNRPLRPMSSASFRRPQKDKNQLTLFE